MKQLATANQEACNGYLKILGWDWNHPRITSWLKRVGLHFYGIPYFPEDRLPDFVYASLARFLDLRIHCERTLHLLAWNWDAPEIRAIERRWRCYNELPLKGYQELHSALDAAWWEQSGGF